MSTNSSSALDDALHADPDPEQPRRPAPVRDSGRAVREFEAICAKHNLTCGSPEDLVPFQQALDQNKLLAMNFWSVVARLGDGKHGQPLGQQEVLDAIVRGVTGQPMEQAIQGQGPAIDRLRRLLAGEDVSLAGEPVAPSANEALSPNQDKGQPLPPVENAPRTTEALLPPEPSAPSEYVASLEPSALSSVAATVDPAFTLEPLPESGPPARLVLQPDHQPASDFGPMSRAAAQQTPLRNALRKQTASDANRIDPERLSRELADPKPVNSTAVEQREKPRLSIPLAAYARHEKDRRTGRRAGDILIALVIAAGLAFLLAQGIMAWRQPDNSARTGAAALGQRSASVFTRFAASVHAGIASAQQAWNRRPPPTNSAASSPTSAPNTPTPATEPPAHPYTSLGATAPPMPRASETPSPASSIGSSMTISRQLDSANVQDPSSNAGDARDSALPQISGDEMKDHLISSRFPIVPDTANADAVRGVVTLEAVVTARGTVEHIHAVSGPENLRQPAIEAVSGWRYRPYLEDGTPADVRTTIRVDFSGND